MKRSFADMLSSMDGELSRKVAAKVPEWAGAIDRLVFPSKLCTEQCSSSEAALGKADFAASIIPGGRIADLTGGLGVDSWAFGLKLSNVLYNERNSELAAAVLHNYQVLGVTNIHISNLEVNADNIDRILLSFRPDMVYMDPARRDSAGKKVFLLEDCEPDVLTLIPAIWKHCGHILLKVSPMADISMLAARLGGSLKEVRVVQVGSEVKELLLHLDKGWTGAYTITAGSLSFTPEEESGAAVSFAPEDCNLPYLFEPSAALLKAGAFKLPCERFGCIKLAASTHLYFCEKPIPEGRNYRIVGSAPLSRQGMKETAATYPQADVTARNIPMSSDELRKRLGVRSGGGIHIFGVTVADSRKLIICRADI